MLKAEQLRRVGRRFRRFVKEEKDRRLIDSSLVEYETITNKIIRKLILYTFLFWIQQI